LVRSSSSPTRLASTGRNVIGKLDFDVKGAELWPALKKQRSLRKNLPPDFVEIKKRELVAARDRRIAEAKEVDRIERERLEEEVRLRDLAIAQKRERDKAFAMERKLANAVRFYSDCELEDVF
jgi:hypothetical protein